jgi:hypothetical protein
VAVVLHDAEDVVHPLELTLFDQLIDRAGLVQLPVMPLVDLPPPGSAVIIATNLPRATARSWSSAKPSAPPFPWRESAAPSSGARWLG